ncbi:putative Histidine kinase [Magnetospirillum sp. LM-5]|uniref:sensor histidine kinase n=1 Tax=Magnetospirillum sp. LM-5 TaxID=2681466 RepID=UPI00137E0CDE|nr:ATP-binding protein [Magnetospirillum sp. LM-5]CAA7616682.1 putative Histidine kinase [Magnetospirillum sp. LM-5]
MRNERSAQSILALLAGVFLTAAVSAHMVLADRAWTHAERSLEQISEALAGHFAVWLDERRGDALVLSKDRLLAEKVETYLADGDDRMGVFLRERLRSLIEAYPYRSVILLAPDGRRVLDVGRESDEIEPSQVDIGLKAVAARVPVTSGLHVEGEEGRHELDIDLGVPLLTVANGPAVAALSISIDPARMIGFVVRGLPLLDEGMEVVLGQRVGDKVVIVDPRGTPDGSENVITRPLSAPELPAAMAARGVRGIVEGIDYKGTRVVAFLRDVPDSNWFLLVKLDRSEIARAERQSGAMVALSTVLAWALAFLGLRTRMTRLANERLEAEIQVRRRQAELTHQIDMDARRLEAIQEGIPIGLAIVTLDRRFESVNEAFVQMTGFSRRDLLGRSTRMIYPSEEIFADLGERAYGALAADQVFSDILTLRRQDGTDIRVAMTARQIRSEPPTTVWACEDVTARLRQQRDLAQAQVALQKQAQDLARSNAELEQFAYVASHDLRQPLRQISSYTTLLERRYGDQLPDDAKSFLNFACSGAKRMDRLILDLLEYSRVGRAERVFALVDLTESIRDAAGNLALDVAETGTDLTLPDRAPAIHGDEVELLRLFQNLIGNAVKYRDPSRPCRVAVTAQETDDQVVVRVADNGIGIPADSAERVFGIFQRLHQGDEVEGTGIGLAVCRKIVEHHRGTIMVEPGADGVGSVFVVSFPHPDRAG